MSKQGIELQVSNLNKSFGKEPVLKNLELTAQAGDFISIVGRSGCGKSTLLRLLAGLERPTSGEITLGNEKIEGIREEVRVMFQEARLLPWLTVVENVEVGLAKTGQGKDKKNARKLATEMLERVGLKGKEQEWPSVLSGGQKQRVALARALISKPKLLLLDEPLGALDAFTRLEMHQLIQQLWEEQQFTAFLVTHDVSEAIALAERVVLLEKGNISMDIEVSMPRPRVRDDHDVAELEQKVINRVMQTTK